MQILSDEHLNCKKRLSADFLGLFLEIHGLVGFVHAVNDTMPVCKLAGSDTYT